MWKKNIYINWKGLFSELFQYKASIVIDQRALLFSFFFFFYTTEWKMIIRLLLVFGLLICFVLFSVQMAHLASTESSLDDTQMQMPHFK